MAFKKCFKTPKKQISGVTSVVVGILIKKTKSAATLILADVPFKPK